MVVAFNVAAIEKSAYALRAKAVFAKGVQDAGQSLHLGQVVEREIKGGEVHAYTLAMSAQQYARICVLRRGIDVAVFVKAAGGEVTKFENPAGARSPIVVPLKSSQSQTYTIEVRPLQKWLSLGRYEIRLEELHAATENDDKRVSAAQRVAAGRTQYLKQTEESRKNALTEYQQALQVWIELGDKFEQANTLQYIAQVHRALRNYNLAELSLREALTARADEAQAKAYTLYELAELSYAQRKFEESLPQYEAALKAFAEAGNRRGQSLAMAQQALTYMRLFRWDDARPLLERAREISRSENDVYEESRILNSLGGVHDFQGRPQEAIEAFLAAVRSFQQLGDLAREGNTYINIGLAYDGWSDWSGALDAYNKSLQLLERAASQPEADKQFTDSKRGVALSNMGALYATLGDFNTAFEYLNRAVKLRDKTDKARTLMWLGYTNVMAGNPQHALSFCDEALSFQEPVKDPARAQTYSVKGAAYEALGERTKAVEFFNKALQIQQDPKTPDVRSEAISLMTRGATYLAMGDLKNADADLTAALALWRGFKDRSGEAQTLIHVARLERKQGNLANAIAAADAAIKLVEPLRTNVLNQQLRATYFSSKVDYYDEYIDLSMQQANGSPERVAAAFAASEKARARGLVDLLSAESLNAGATAEPELAALVSRRRTLQRNSIAKAAQQTRMLSRGEPNAAALEKELAAIAAEQVAVERQIKSKFPRYASLMWPEPLNVKGVQQLLDDDSVLLEFHLGERSSYVWAISRNEFSGHALPSRNEIEPIARRLKVAINDNQPREGESAMQRQTRRREAERVFRSEGSVLSRALLGPVEKLLTKKRLLIVADGELAYVPFASLPAPDAVVNDTSVTTALITRQEVVNLPSATVLSTLRHSSERRTTPMSVAVFADPVFEKNDSRIAPAKRAHESINGRVAALLRDFDSELKTLPRLPATAREARDILSLVPAGASMDASGFKANRKNATDQRLGKFSIIHFATHGMLDEKNPELSGIVLSLYDEQGEYHEEGYLSLTDIYELKLPVDLVVLSACRTGLGKQVRGEGLIGLTRGFMYAGASRVVASLWKVDDTATAELMKRFYRGMLHDKMTPASALREAQKSMSEEPRWRNPYFWSGFVLQGEWR